MSLSSQLLAELRARAGQGANTISIAAGPRTVVCHVLQCDALAVTVDELRLDTPELAAVSVQQLQSASRDLAARVNYLLEPIAPIETDAAGCHVQMRSNPPQKDDDGLRYYELLLARGGSASLSRYEKQPGQPRTRVAAALTHEVVSRLIGDFAVTIDSL
jgi:hypothetical protein